MSRGAAGKLWEPLKTNGNFCDITRHGIRESASQFSLYLIVLSVYFMAGAGGFEPPHGGIIVPRSDMLKPCQQKPGATVVNWRPTI